MEIAEFLLSKYDLQNYSPREQEVIHIYVKRPPSDAIKAFFENEKDKFQQECESAAERYWPTTQKEMAYKAIIFHITTHLKMVFKDAMLRRAIVNFYYAATTATLLSVEDQRKKTILPPDVNQKLIEYFDFGILFSDQETEDWEGVLCD